MKVKLIRKAAVIITLLVFCLSLLPVSAVKEPKNTDSKAAEVKGTTYYISNSEGNDINDGLSEDTPWKSFKHLEKLQLKGGDKLLLKCGDRWVGEHFNLTAPTGESESNMVLISSYGKGDKPKIALYEDKVPKYSNIPLMKIINAEYLEIKGLDIGHCGIGLNLYYDLVENKKCVKITECHFHDIYGFHQVDSNTTEFPHAMGIAVNGRVKMPGTADPLLKGLYIDKCTTYDVGALYSYSSTMNHATNNTIHGLYITNTDMVNNGIYGVALCGMRYGYMDNCRIIDCGSRPAPHGSMAIMQSAKDYTVMNCEIAYQQRHEQNPDGGGIDFEHMSYDNDYINNYIHDNSGVGVMFYTSGGDQTHENRRIRFLYNVFENNNCNVSNVGGAELICIPAYALNEGLIYNNKYMESRNDFTMYMLQTV
ncbi:MAG: right-handed parallel beta-helix repeat-containing protein, partial [Clostridia bacterium]|nr:right-handed parallel beta-helix repeat-containing protein [Clostridia bacterium]